MRIVTQSDHMRIVTQSDHMQTVTQSDHMRTLPQSDHTYDTTSNSTRRGSPVRATIEILDRRRQSRHSPCRHFAVGALPEPHHLDLYHIGQIIGQSPVSHSDQDPVHPWSDASELRGYV